MDKLFPHQVAAVEFLKRNPRSGLFDDQGLGKTAAAIVACEGERTLVVCPASVLHNWQREITRWSPRPVSVQIVTGGATKIGLHDFVVMSHGMLLSPNICSQVESFGAIILDEGHQLRNPTAKRTKVFYLGKDAICRRAPRCHVLTGTPVANHPGELWPMLAGLAPARVRDEAGALMTHKAWMERFCVLAPNPFSRYGPPRVVGIQRAPELSKRMHGFALRRMKDDVLDLPPVRRTTVLLDGGRAANEPLLETEADIEQQIAAPKPAFSTWRKACGIAKVAPAVELLANDLQSGMRKVVVAVHHTEVGAEIRSGLDEFGAMHLHGGTPPAQRAEMVEAFQTDARIRVIVCQIQAGGVGITLTAAQDVVFVEQSFVPADNAQMADRVRRIGQNKPVLVRALALADSVDEVLTTVLLRKTVMIAEVRL